VVAEDAGPRGNVPKGTIIGMPSPPPGVDGVVNEEDVTGGLAEESDDELRARAKRKVESGARGTVAALADAVRAVAGVDDVEVTDQNLDPTLAPGVVRVRYGVRAGDEARAAVIASSVDGVVDRTRPAGILADVGVMEPPQLVSGDCAVFPTPDYRPNADDVLRTRILDTLSALGVNEPVSLRRLSALGYGVDGIAEVAELVLRLDGAVTTTDPLIPGAGRFLRPGAFAVVALAELSATVTRVGEGALLKVGILGGGKARRFAAFSVPVVVTVEAPPANSPSAPMQRLTTRAGVLSFTDSDSASLTYPEIPGWNAISHAPTVRFGVALVGFSAVAPATADLDLTSPG
jgi:hypothetical protein